MFVSGCLNAQNATHVPVGDLEAYCVASEAGVQTHAKALADTADVEVLLSGDLVIRQRDAACALTENQSPS